VANDTASQFNKARRPRPLLTADLTADFSGVIGIVEAHSHNFSGDNRRQKTHVFPCVHGIGNLFRVGVFGLDCLEHLGHCSQSRRATPNTGHEIPRCPLLKHAASSLEVHNRLIAKQGAKTPPTSTLYQERCKLHHQYLHGAKPKAICKTPAPYSAWNTTLV
jgi:hypothetical protein